MLKQNTNNQTDTEATYQEQSPYNKYEKQYTDYAGWNSEDTRAALQKKNRIPLAISKFFVFWFISLFHASKELLIKLTNRMSLKMWGKSA
jgi:hypothetical protein